MSTLLGRRTLVWALVIIVVLIAALPPAHSQDAVLQKIESDNALIAREGTWLTQPTSAASGGSYLYNAPADVQQPAALSLEFTGPSVEIVYVAGPTLGTLAIEVDGVVLRTVITTAPEVAYGQSAKIDYLTDEAHSLRVYAQAGGVVGVDAIGAHLPRTSANALETPVQDSPRLAFPACGSPAPVRRMVVALDGNMITYNGWNFQEIQVTGDGQYIVFSSWLRNLLPNLTYPYHTNLYPAVYRVNIQTCQIELVSQDVNGRVAEAKLSGSSVDGNTIIFSTAVPMVTSDTNSAVDIYLRDMTTGVISLISQNAQGETGNGQAYAATISRDGRYIVFASTSTNLDPADTSDDHTLYILDRQSNQLSLVPDAVAVNVPYRQFSNLSISDDGRYIAYQYPVFASYYLPYPFMVEWHAWIGQIFMSDRQTATGIQITQWGGNPYTLGNMNPQITGDGRYIYYEARIDEYGGDDIMRYDVRTTGLATAADAYRDGTDLLKKYAISSDGRYLVFARANDLSLLDQQTNSTVHLTEGYDGHSINARAVIPSISDDGRFVTFVSGASNIVPNDNDLDHWGWGSTDLFLLDRQQVRPIHTTLRAYAAYARRVDLRWTQHSPTPTQFEVQRLQVGFGNDWIAVGTTEPNATYYSDSSVALGVRYFYRLRVLTLDPNYSEYSTASEVTTYDHLNHTFLLVTVIGVEEVRLSWEQLAPDPTEFELQRAADGGAYVPIATIPIGQTSYIDNLAGCNIHYSYRLRPLILHPDYSDYSSSVAARIPCPADTLALFNPSTRQISLMNTLAVNPPPTAYTTFTSNARASGQWVMGDWDGDGVKTPGVYETSGAFMFTNALGPNATWDGVWFGLLGKMPVAGRFDPNVNHDCLGVVDSAEFPPYGIGYATYFTCNLGSGPTPPLQTHWLSVPYFTDGNPHGAVQIVAGDFNGDGVDTVGFRRDRAFRYTNGSPQNPAAEPFSEYTISQHVVPVNDYGIVVMGDWDDDGTDDVGLLTQTGEFAYQYGRTDFDLPAYWQHVGQPVGTPIQAASWR